MQWYGGVLVAADLTSECWLVQFYGREYCEMCSRRDTDDCNGKEIRKTGKNSKGVTVPVVRGGILWQETEASK